MLDARQFDIDATREEDIQIAARRATAPNQPSPGNAAGVAGGFTNLVVAPPTGTETGLPEGVYPDEIGVDPDGNFWHPFHLGIDTPDDDYAYVPTGYPTRNYGF